MKQLAVLLTALSVISVFCLHPVSACGPFLDSAVFSGDLNPDAPLEGYVAGNLGIIQPTYARSYLFVAYRYLSGAGFTEEEQRAVLKLINDRIADNYEYRGFASDSDVRPAVKEWMDARALVAGKGTAPDVMKRSDYSFFPNCLDDAFTAAARTLRERIGRYGAAAPEVSQWLKAQDQVFEDCSGGKTIPGSLPDAADALAAADRAYQIAAAHFYSGHYDQAAELFHAIAGDSGSPWRQIAPYLEGRALLRKALPVEEKAMYEALPTEEARAEAKKRFAAAEQQFMRILERSDLAEYHHAARRLVNLIRFRLNPDERRRELAASLVKETPAGEIEQNLADYLFLLDGFLPDGDDGRDSGAGAKKDENAGQFMAALNEENDLTDWISTFQTGGPEALQHALERYNARKSIPWLAAALAMISPDNPGFPALLEEARKVPGDSPAYVFIGFHMARCLDRAGRADEARTKADELLARPAAGMPRSSLNLIMSLRMVLSRNMDEFLRYSQRAPVRSFTENDYPYAKTQDQNGWEKDPGQVRLHELMGGKTLFDADAAVVFNEMLPPGLWRQAIESPILPDHLRLEVARSAWVRSVLLEKEDMAAASTAFLKERDAVLGPSLAAYADARTREAKKYAAVFTMLKHPGLRPHVSGGLGRLAPANQLDDYRDNWWCASQCIMTTGENCPAGSPGLSTDGMVMNDSMKALYPGNKMASPGFISTSDRAAAAAERKALAALGPGPNYLAGYVASYAKGKTPPPGSLPEALHLAVKSTRYGCTDSQTTKYSKEAFLVLHKKFPKNPWTEKTPYWF